MNLNQGSTAVTLFRQACTDFDFKDKHKIRTLITVLESTAQVVAQNELFRYIDLLGSSLHGFHNNNIDDRLGRIRNYGQTCASSGEILLVHNFLFGTMTTIAMKNRRKTMKMTHSELFVPNWQNSPEI